MESDSNISQIFCIFNEAKTNIETRAEQCQKLLSSTQSLLNNLDTLNRTCSLIRPSIEPFSNSRNIIQQRNDLSKSHAKIDALLENKVDQNCVLI